VTARAAHTDAVTWPRVAVATAAVSAALVLQVSSFTHPAWRGVVPDLVLLVVVAVGLARGAEFAMVFGFAAGLLLDLAPPADHVAGRWALALVVVGYVAGRMRTSGRPSTGAVLGTSLACTFVGTSVFALTGLVLRDPAVGVPDLLAATLASLAWAAVLAIPVVRGVLALFARVEPERAWAR
jgi:rod shape-determining protein MreD